jgi:hypothetical protein
VERLLLLRVAVVAAVALMKATKTNTAALAAVLSPVGLTAQI